MRGRTDSSLSSSAVTHPLRALDAASIIASVTFFAPTPMTPSETPEPASSPGVGVKTLTAEAVEALSQPCSPQGCNLPTCDTPTQDLWMVIAWYNLQYRDC